MIDARLRRQVWHGAESAIVAAGDPHLQALFDPRSVAIVGASNDPMKWGYGLARGALRGDRSPRRLPRQPKRRRDPRSSSVPIARRDFPSRRNSSLSRCRSRASRRPSTARSPWVPARSSASRPVSARRARRAEPASRRSSARPGRGRGAARAELPRCLRCRRRAGHRLERASRRRDRARLAERQPRPRAGAHRPGTVSVSRGSSHSATRRISRPPSSLTASPSTSRRALSRSTWRTSATAERSRAACHAAEEAGKPVVLLAAGRARPQAAPPARTRVRSSATSCCRGRVPGRGHRAGVNADRADRHRPGAARASTSRGAAASPSSATEAATGSSPPTSPRRPVSTCPQLGERWSTSWPMLGPTAVTGNPVDLAGGGEQDIVRFEGVTRVASLVRRGRRRAPDRLLRRVRRVRRPLRGARGRDREVARSMAAEAAAADRSSCRRCIPRADRRPLRSAGVPVYGETQPRSARSPALPRGERTPSGVPALPAERAGPPTT